MAELAPQEDDAVAALAARLRDDPDELVRSTSALALGRIGRKAANLENTAREAQVARRPEIAAALLPALDPEREATGTDLLGLARSIVRETAGFALVELATRPDLLDARTREELATGLERTTRDPDKFVVGHAQDALGRLSS